MILQKLCCRQAFLWNASEHFQHDGEDQFSLTWICVWATVRYCFCEFTMVRLPVLVIPRITAFGVSVETLPLLR